MKLKTVIEAKPALIRLTEKRFCNYRKIRELVKLRKAVETEFDIYVEQEKKAVEAYAEKKKDGSPVLLENGRIKLKDAPSKVWKSSLPLPKSSPLLGSSSAFCSLSTNGI